MADLQRPVSIQSILPQTAGSIGRPSIPAKSAGPGTSLTPVARVPGQRVPFPGSALSANTRRDKSGNESNEPIVTSMISDVWENQHYEQYQQPGDWLLRRMKTKGNGESCPMVSVAQFNEILRVSWKQIQTYVNANQARKSPFLLYQGVAAEAPNEVMQLFEKSLVPNGRGEGVFTENDKIKEKILYNKQLALLITCSPWHILEIYKSYGNYASDSGRFAKPHLTLDIQTGGPMTYQETWNLWGNVREGDNLFFILKRKLDTSRSTEGRRVYGEFQFVPHACHAAYPSMAARYYQDDAGIDRWGEAIIVGSVNKLPIYYPNPDLIPIKAGLTADAQQAFATKIETVSVAIRQPHVNMDLWS